MKASKRARSTLDLLCNCSDTRSYLSLGGGLWRSYIGGMSRPVQRDPWTIDRAQIGGPTAIFSARSKERSTVDDVAFAPRRRSVLWVEL